MGKEAIGIRMKDQYESRYKISMTRRCPTIIRLDGKAFHTYTKGLNKPFDETFIMDMQQTAIKLCEEVQGCKMAYLQSDEISLLLTDYEKETTQAWFDYEVQKIASVSASIATAHFNNIRNHKLAYFDSRVFQIADHEEVVNYFIWRQQDAIRNSISMLVQSLYSQKQLHGKNTSKMQEMCFQKGQNWNDLSVYKKRGTVIIKREFEKDGIMRSAWMLYPPPEFSKGRDYILDKL